MLAPLLPVSLSLLPTPLVVLLFGSPLIVAILLLSTPEETEGEVDLFIFADASTKFAPISAPVPAIAEGSRCAPVCPFSLSAAVAGVVPLSPPPPVLLSSSTVPADIPGGENDCSISSFGRSGLRALIELGRCGTWWWWL